MTELRTKRVFRNREVKEPQLKLTPTDISIDIYWEITYTDINCIDG